MGQIQPICDPPATMYNKRTVVLFDHAVNDEHAYLHLAYICHIILGAGGHKPKMSWRSGA